MKAKGEGPHDSLRETRARYALAAHAGRTRHRAAGALPPRRERMPGVTPPPVRDTKQHASKQGGASVRPLEAQLANRQALSSSQDKLPQDAATENRRQKENASTCAFPVLAGAIHLVLCSLGQLPRFYISLPRR
jgi:hypothetical protein